MRMIQNRKLTENFWLYEFIEAQLPVKAVVLNWENIHQFMPQQNKYIELAQLLQSVRNLVNSEFRIGNGNRDIGIRITSGFRCKQWELIRGRNGSSQHCVGAAADIQPVNCPTKMAVEIMFWLWDRYWPRATGHQGGFAIKRPEYKNNVVQSLGFLHFDVRGTAARWEYP